MRWKTSPRAARLLPLLAAALLAASAGALTAPGGLDALEDADRTALERLSGEPAAVRDLALEAALHPDVLVEMQLLQERTSAEFQQRIEGLSREDQEAVWEITREPGLLHEVAASDASRETLERIASERPERVREAILRVGSEHAELLARLQDLAADAEEQFELLIEDLPPDTRESFRELVDHPEVVTLLATHVRLTVELGDAYREDPRGTRLHLEALGHQVARREARAAEAWEEAIADDPEAAAELEEAARTYAEEQGVAYDDVTSPTIETTVHVSVHPYPYWFGYPVWYAHPYDPWAWWYPPLFHFGFYIHPHHHSFVWFGLPSFHFLYWYEHVWLVRPVYRHHGHHGHVFTHLERHRKHYRHLRHVKAHHRHPRHVRRTLRDRPARHALREQPRHHGFERSLRPRRGSHGEPALRWVRSERRDRRPAVERPHRRRGEGARVDRRERRGREGARLDRRDRGREGARVDRRDRGREDPRLGTRRGRRGGETEARRGGRRRPGEARARPGRRDPDVVSPRNRDRRDARERRGVRQRRDARDRRGGQRQLRRDRGAAARRDGPPGRRREIGERSPRAERQARGRRAIRGPDPAPRRVLKPRARGHDRPRARGPSGRGRGPRGSPRRR